MDYIAIKKFKNKLKENEVLGDEEKINKIKTLNFEKEEQTEKELYRLKTEKDEELELLQKNLSQIDSNNNIE